MRVPGKPLNEYPWPVRMLFRLQKKKYGVVLNPALLWGRLPRLYYALSVLYGALEHKRSRLDPVLRSLLLVRISQINDCRFCVDINSANLAERAGAMDKVQAVSEWTQCDLFDAREKCALEYAEAMTLPQPGVTDELVLRLRGYFDEDAAVELTALIAYQNMSTKFNNALDVAPQGFCEWRAPDA